MTTTLTPGDDASGAAPAHERPAPAQPASTGDATRPAHRGGHRAMLALLLTGTGLLYLVNLSASGWANEFYSAAAQAGSKSWTAMLFGSLDSANFITVDKPPASLWVLDLSVRVFGLSSWSILVPQALMGAASVALLCAAVKRVSTPSAGLLAGAILATTPVAVLMFRFNNPDALLVLLMTAAGYTTVRAVEAARFRWLALAGTLLGFAFLTKMLQGFLVVPAFAVAYLVAAPTPLRNRILHLLGAGGAMIVAAGWWVALVELWPAGSRPYIGGTNHNSVLELIFGYNGIGRLNGSSNNGNVTGGGGGFSSSETGWTRMFGSDMGSQLSWLLPAALIGIAALGWLCWRRPRTDRLRASTIIWGGWVLCTGLVLSFAGGIIHPYYSVALAPGIAATAALAIVSLWQARSSETAHWVLAAIMAVSAWWGFELLGRDASWNSWLRWVVVLLGAGATTAVVMPRMVAALVAPLVTASLLVAPIAYAVQTASTAHTGALPSAGPADGFGAFPGGGFGGMRPTGGGTRPTGGGARPTGGATFPTGRGTGPTGGGAGGGTGGFGRTGGASGGGLGGATPVSSALTSALRTNASRYTWAAATISSNNASSLELASGQAVMALGGYNGTDPAISLVAFEKLVSAGAVHYFIADAQGFLGSTVADSSDAYRIQQWVEAKYTAHTIGTSTVYDLSR